MRASKIFLAIFVVLCHDPNYTHGEDILPQDEVDTITSKMCLLDEFVFQRYLQTEESTCRAVVEVYYSMRRSIRRDLLLELSETRKHIYQARHTRNQTTQRCLRNLRDDLWSSVREEERVFFQCTEMSPTILSQLIGSVREDRKIYNLDRKETLESMNECLKRFNNDEQKVHWKNCLEKVTQKFSDSTDNMQNFTLLHGPCMAHFTQTLVTCARESFDRIIVKNLENLERFKNCAGFPLIKSQDVLTPYHGREGRITSENIAQLTQKYIELNTQFEKKLDQYLELERQAKITGTYSQEYVYNKLQSYMEPYYETLNKTKKENRSQQDKCCTVRAENGIDTVISEAFPCYNSCYQETVSQINLQLMEMQKGFEQFSNVFAPSGNIAILKCFDKRPQQIFSIDAIRSCYEVNFSEVSFTWDSVARTMDKSVEVLANSLQSLHRPSCVEEIYTSIFVKADKILNDCQECLFQVNGYYYAVTTPPTTTTSPPSTTKTAVPTTDLSTDTTRPPTTDLPASPSSATPTTVTTTTFTPTTVTTTTFTPTTVTTTTFTPTPIPDYAETD